MTPNLFNFQTVNTILYCQHWQATVDFYQQCLKLPVNFASDWFVEFLLTDTARLSVADERRATIKRSDGTGLTLTFQVENIHAAWQILHERGGAPGAIKAHKWGAQVFYLHDPEGHRLEFWSPNAA
jgi:predicted enzyme related to lactoylglutathione lyase